MNSILLQINVWKIKLLCIIINEAQKIAFAGVGNPIKFTDCLVSTLNLASLNPEKTGISMAINRINISLYSISRIGVSIIKRESFSMLKAIKPGTNPKLIKSAKESSSFPISE